ncbi:hypothetical protein AG1IA_10462 [Rhizoctonia solani AG-1 IA]|uniref:Uncharacterized protein n=1 Tax=Thanatephorus cucumeris (strain AG1-IA) TaxID=983506 RepID=L8WFE7_THACA|nr:hypothetical protein AG1IA_10462 [Rhizoctonia solani AG-1 IA]
MALDSLLGRFSAEGVGQIFRGGTLKWEKRRKEKTRCSNAKCLSLSTRFDFQWTWWRLSFDFRGCSLI